VVIIKVPVLSGKYPTNFTGTLDGADVFILPDIGYWYLDPAIVPIDAQSKGITYLPYLIRCWTIYEPCYYTSHVTIPATLLYQPCYYTSHVICIELITFGNCVRLGMGRFLLLPLRIYSRHRIVIFLVLFIR
jgi:hypothetical protein